MFKRKFEASKATLISIKLSVSVFIGSVGNCPKNLMVLVVHGFVHRKLQHFNKELQVPGRASNFFFDWEQKICSYNLIKQHSGIKNQFKKNHFTHTLLTISLIFARNAFCKIFTNIDKITTSKYRYIFSFEKY